MSNFIDSKRREKAEARVRQIKRAEVMEWYLANNFGRPPEQQCVDKKAYNRKILYWLEPPIPLVNNPVLIEEQLGDQWTIRIEFGRPRSS